MAETPTEIWALVEMMGHQRIVGRVSQDTSLGPALTRVDVPAVAGMPAFSKLLGAASIYAVTPLEEETALHMAASLQAQPLEEWSARRLVENMDRARAPQLAFDQADEDDDDHDDGWSR